MQEWKSLECLLKKVTITAVSTSQKFDSGALTLVLFPTTVWPIGGGVVSGAGLMTACRGEKITSLGKQRSGPGEKHRACMHDFAFI